MKKLLALALTLCMLLSLCSFAAAEADKKLTIWTWDPTFNIAARWQRKCISRSTRR